MLNFDFRFADLICCFRGGKQNEKCPVAIADLVLLYNAAQEGLYGPSKHDRSAFDLFALCPGTKSGFVKFCKAHEQRIRTLLHTFRVIRADADDEGDTCIQVSGFLAEWNKSKKVLKSLKLDMQFLDHHRKQFLDLHADLSKLEYSPQSEAALTNFKALLLLEIALLSGNDFDWSSPADTGKGGGAAIAVLTAGSGHDDADDSGADAAEAVASPEGEAAAAADAAGAADAGAAPAVRASPAAPDPAAAAPAAAAAGAVLDVNDFTSWTSDTWALLDWDSVSFPSDPSVNIASKRYYLAVAMILWYQADLREKHKRVWDELNYAWLATFSCDLHPVGMEKWPRTGPFAFNDIQCTWLTETLRFLKSGGRSRRVSAPRRAPEIAPASHSATSASAGKRKRPYDPVKQNAKRYTYWYYCYYCSYLYIIELLLLCILL
jgi:hypothetical protein